MSRSNQDRVSRLWKQHRSDNTPLFEDLHPLIQASVRSVVAAASQNEDRGMPNTFGAVITSVTDNNGVFYDQMVFDGTCWARHDVSRLPSDIVTYTYNPSQER